MPTIKYDQQSIRDIGYSIQDAQRKTISGTRIAREIVMGIAYAGIPFYEIQEAMTWHNDLPEGI